MDIPIPSGAQRSPTDEPTENQFPCQTLVACLDGTHCYFEGGVFVQTRDPASPLPPGTCRAGASGACPLATGYFFPSSHWGRPGPAFGGWGVAAGLPPQPEDGRRLSAAGFGSPTAVDTQPTAVGAQAATVDTQPTPKAWPKWSKGPKRRPSWSKRSKQSGPGGGDTARLHQSNCSIGGGATTNAVLWHRTAWGGGGAGAHPSTAPPLTRLPEERHCRAPHAPEEAPALS